MHMAGGSIARGKGRRAKKVDSISGLVSDFTRGRRNKDNSTEEEGKHPAKPQTKPQKNKSPKPVKVVGSLKGRHHALIDSCIYIGIETGDEINAGLNAQKP